jgi:L-threonylcarbamoyladenylate synthase
MSVWVTVLDSPLADLARFAHRLPVKTEILNPSGIARAVRLLASGELVAFGTETVYGLGADACNAQAVAAIFAAKGRPRFNPLICHYESPDAAFAHVQPNEMALRLADTFWPGPLTMVLPRRAGCPVALLAGAGLDTLAVRVPAHAVAQRLIAAFGGPLAAPSANPSGAVSPTSVQHVLAGLGGRIAAVIDSGPCRVGLESAVIDLTGAAPTLLRPGGVSLESLNAAIGDVQIGAAPAGALRSPGLLASHYAPVLPLRMNAGAIGADEALLAFGPSLSGARLLFQLSETQNLNQAAARLFEGLHWLDNQAPAHGLAGIAAMTIPDHGLGLAINDRLRRASYSAG